MSQILPTLIVAFILILLACLGLAIGWLLTGKTRLRGSCGGIAGKKRDDSCDRDITCGLCGRKGAEEEPTGEEEEQQKS